MPEIFAYPGLTIAVLLLGMLPYLIDYTVHQFRQRRLINDKSRNAAIQDWARKRHFGVSMNQTSKKAGIREHQVAGSIGLRLFHWFDRPAADDASTEMVLTAKANGKRLTIKRRPKPLQMPRTYTGNRSIDAHFEFKTRSRKFARELLAPEHIQYQLFELLDENSQDERLEIFGSGRIKLTTKNRPFDINRLDIAVDMLEMLAWQLERMAEERDVPQSAKERAEDARQQLQHVESPAMDATDIETLLDQLKAEERAKLSSK